MSPSQATAPQEKRGKWGDPPEHPGGLSDTGVTPTAPPPPLWGHKDAAALGGGGKADPGVPQQRGPRYRGGPPTPTPKAKPKPPLQQPPHYPHGGDTAPSPLQNLLGGTPHVTWAPQGQLHGAEGGGTHRDPLPAPNPAEPHGPPGALNRGEGGLGGDGRGRGKAAEAAGKGVGPHLAI